MYTYFIYLVTYEYLSFLEMSEYSFIAFWSFQHWKETLSPPGPSQERRKTFSLNENCTWSRPRPAAVGHPVFTRCAVPPSSPPSPAG